MRQRPSGRRITTFDEVAEGLDGATAQFEARRCLSCDSCYGVCPDNAVVKLRPGGRYEIDLDYCKGCGICAAECPVRGHRHGPGTDLSPSAGDHRDQGPALAQAGATIVEGTGHGRPVPGLVFLQ
jgi:Pyruvate/2-oxoacid:ferredoxin oxidoreductase delta subunit